VHRICSFVGNVCPGYGGGRGKVRSRRRSRVEARAGRFDRWFAAARDESGQALPLALGGCFVLIAAAIALVAIAGAVTGKGRAQRAADLAAISAVRSMRDDLSQLLSPPRLPNGHLTWMFSKNIHVKCPFARGGVRAARGVG